MKHMGNVCNVDGHDIELVSCITFGSPCQDLSVAGKRAGMKHEANGDDETTRSGLFYEAVRIIREMREKVNELRMSGADVDRRLVRYAIYENVPGALSSNNGEDFRCVLEQLCRIKDESFSIPRPKDNKGRDDKWAKAGYIEGDGFSVAWKISDAQFYGVPQRRKRICVLVDYEGYSAGRILLTDDLEYSGTSVADSRHTSVGSFGNRWSGREVQFKREGLPGYIKSCVTPWKGIAPNPEICINVNSRESEESDDE